MQKIGNNVAYFAGLAQVPDPSIKNLPARLQSLSTLYAIQGPTGNFFYKTQLPGRSERSALPFFAA